MTDPTDRHKTSLLRDNYELAKFCAHRLHAHNVAAMSAALSFRTIFALIPLLVLAFLVARSVGVVDDGKLALRNFLNASGISHLSAPQDSDDPATLLFEGPIDPTQPVNQPNPSTNPKPSTSPTRSNPSSKTSKRNSPTNASDPSAPSSLSGPRSPSSPRSNPRSTASSKPPKAGPSADAS